MLTRRLCTALLAVAVCASTALAQQNKLIPMPREYHATADQSLSKGVHITCAGTCSADDQFAVSDLVSALTDRKIVTGAGGFHIEFAHLGSRPLPSGVTFDDAMKPEGYVISATPSGLTIIAATPEGIFYGAQTVKQMIVGTGTAAVLKAATIRDWPAMKYRGLSDDMSRGPFPTLDFIKKQIRVLASMKVNIYSPYMENTQQYPDNAIAAPWGRHLSPSDARELVTYARPYHITIIPEQEAFGHLDKMLQYEQYSELAETPHGAVLAPGQAGSIPLIQDMFAQLAAEYPGPFLHLGADETGELGAGQTKAEVQALTLNGSYLKFMNRIVEALKPLNRKLLFWGDIAYHSPDLVKAMPQSFKDATVAVPWTYNPEANGFDRYIKPFTDAGFETWVAPGINNWSRVFPNGNLGLYNIQQFTRDGQRLGCDGQLNTIWNDDGEGLANMDWYGILFGASAAWQKGESSIPDFQHAFGQNFHGDLSGKIDEAQIEFMTIHSLIRDQAHAGDANDSLFWLDPWDPASQTNIDRLRPVVPELRRHAEHIVSLIAEARQAAADAGTPLREQDALDAMDLGARRADLIGYKIEMADEMAQNYRDALNTFQHPELAPPTRGGGGGRGGSPAARVITAGGNRITNLMNAYSAIRDEYSAVWMTSNVPVYLNNIQQRYDHTIQMWMDRTDHLRTLSRDYKAGAPLPTPEQLGFPASFANPPSAPPPAPPAR
jgi:hexosaminidase